MALNYETDVKFGENLYQTGTQAVTDGTAFVDLTADSPDLLVVDPGDTFWMDRSSDGRRVYGTIISVNNATKIIEVNTTLPVEGAATWGTLDDADLATKLSYRTASDLPLMETRRLMRERGLWEKNPITRARDIGKIGAAMTDPAFDPGAFAGLVAFAGALYEESSNAIRMHSNLETAERLTQVMGYLQSQGHIDAEDVAELLEIGGGLAHPGGVVAADVQAARTTEANRLATSARQTAAKAKLDELKALANSAVSEAELAYRAATFSVDVDHAANVHAAWAAKLAEDSGIAAV